jgi:hypothetical protein
MAFAMSTLRQYYPWRSGLHLSNTMRNTITNRGNGYITRETRDVRKRHYQDERGVTINRESGAKYEKASIAAIGDDPSRSSTLRVLLGKMSSEDSVRGQVARFVIDVPLQEAFCAWLEQRIPACAGADDVADAVARSGCEYHALLANFLGEPRVDVQRALRHVQQLAA